MQKCLNRLNQRQDHEVAQFRLANLTGFFFNGWAWDIYDWKMYQKDNKVRDHFRSFSFHLMNNQKRLFIHYNTQAYLDICRLMHKLIHWHDYFMDIHVWVDFFLNSVNYICQLMKICDKEMDSLAGFKLC